MRGRLALLFIVLPLVDMYLLLTLGAVMGFWPTVGLVVLTGTLGAALARQQGTKVLSEWSEAVNRGAIPQEGIVSSLLVLVGGVLLVTPGVITDAIGFTLLVPPSRRLVAGVLKRRLEQRFQINTMDMGAMGPGGLGSTGPGTGPTFVHFDGFSDPRARADGPRIRPGGIIDVEAEPVDPKD